MFFVIAFSLLHVLNFFITNAYSYPTGISGRTKMSTTSGCGSCHNFGTYINAVISGPDTLIKGAFAQYSITITKTNSGKGGMDIAALKGTLDITGSGNYLKILNGELVHQNGITFTGSITINFQYCAPNIVTTDTIFATVNAGYQGRWNFVPEKIIVVKSSIGIENNISNAQIYELKQNYPNPFNPNTVINFQLERTGFTSLIIYDILGKEVTKIVNENLTAGNHKALFNGSSFPSGVYFYRLESAKFVSQKSMILIK
jgi:hypothetical protein